MGGGESGVRQALWDHSRGAAPAEAGPFRGKLMGETFGGLEASICMVCVPGSGVGVRSLPMEVLLGRNGAPSHRGGVQVGPGDTETLLGAIRGGPTGGEAGFLPQSEQRD